MQGAQVCNHSWGLQLVYEEIWKSDMWRASALCFHVVVFFVLFLHWYQKCTWIPITHKKAFKTTKCLLLNRQHCKLSPSSALARWPAVSCTCGAERRLRVTARGWSGAPAVARRLAASSAACQRQRRFRRCLQPEPACVCLLSQVTLAAASRISFH